MFPVCPWPARSWLGPALDTPSATRAPAWCDGAESISTRLLEPPSAVIVITHPGPVSQPTIYAICTQMWNYEAASHKRDRLSWLHRFLHRRDYDDGFAHHRIVSGNWRWFLEETKWPSTELASGIFCVVLLNCLFPGVSSSLDVPHATNTHSISSPASVQVHGRSVFIYCPCCPCSSNNINGTFRLIINPPK